MKNLVQNTLRLAYAAAAAEASGRSRSRNRTSGPAAAGRTGGAKEESSLSGKVEEEAGLEVLEDVSEGRR